MMFNGLFLSVAITALTLSSGAFGEIKLTPCEKVKTLKEDLDRMYLAYGQMVHNYQAADKRALRDKITAATVAKMNAEAQCQKCQGGYAADMAAYDQLKKRYSDERDVRKRALMKGQLDALQAKINGEAVGCI